MSDAPQAGRRRVFVWAALFGYATLAFTLARNVLLVPLYLHYIALDEFGSWLATGGALVQLLVTDFGLAGVITQRIAGLTGRQHVVGTRAAIAAGIANAFVLAVLMSAACSVVAPWLPATQGLDAAQVARVTRCFLIAVAANSLGIVASAGLAVLRGGQRPVVAGIVSLLADIASVAVTLAGLLSGTGLYAIAFGLLTRSAVTMLGGFFAIAPLFRESPRDWIPQRIESLAMWRDSARFFLTSIAMRLQTQCNILLVGTILGPQTAAIYGLTVRAHETVQIVMAQLNTAFGPVLAHLAGAGNVERYNGVIRNLLPLLAAFAAIGAGCVIALNESFVDLWVGPTAFGGWQLTMLMALALWLTSIANVGYEALLARGEFAAIARAFALGSVVHIAVLVAVLQLLGSWAAPLALCASSLCWGTIIWRRVAFAGALSGHSRHSFTADIALTGFAGLAAGTFLWQLLPAATGWTVFGVESAVCGLTIAALLLAVRPALRRLLVTEIGATLRSMRIA